MTVKSLRRVACAVCFAASASALASPPTEIVGYYPGWKSAAYPVTEANVDPGRVSTLLYAFLDVCWNGRHGNPDPSAGIMDDCKEANGALVFRDAAMDGANLRALAAMKRKYPAFKIMLSVGGWNWSNQFSNVASDPAARANFIASSVAQLRRFGIDGIDIDWEYPTAAGVPCTAGQVCDRPADKQNFIKLARELRSALDAAGKADRKHYLITIAAGGNASYVNESVAPDAGSTWLRELSASLDWINIMAYDYHMPWEQASGHHSALMADPADPLQAGGLYAQASVQRFLKAGVAADKLVLGVPFYGHGWKGCPAGAAGDGQYQLCAGPTDGGNEGGTSYGFGHLLRKGYLAAADDGYVGAQGYTRRWNAAARAPFLYNPATQVWISYEDPASLHEKASYIKAQQLRGAMFWELSADDGHQLLRALSAEFPRK
jgi:chitinase